jgi:hypothetical protein
MRSPKHHLLPPGMAGHGLPPAFKSLPQSQRMETPVVRWVGQDPRGTGWEGGSNHPKEVWG